MFKSYTYTIPQAIEFCRTLGFTETLLRSCVSYGRKVRVCQMLASDGSEYVELRWANGKYAGEPSS